MCIYMSYICHVERACTNTGVLASNHFTLTHIHVHRYMYELNIHIHVHVHCMCMFRSFFKSIALIALGLIVFGVCSVPPSM